MSGGVPRGLELRKGTLPQLFGAGLSPQRPRKPRLSSDAPIAITRRAFGVDAWASATIKPQAMPGDMFRRHRGAPDGLAPMRALSASVRQA
ncbi:hypothetical protein JDN40_06305 [Rhodomicrobium vannielii ATCC 17100]|nr:hypothetical protein [Rhodomicrobium vannielii ATCC 17100]